MSGHTFIGDEVDQENAQSFIDLIYETKDGFISVAVMRDKEWAALAHVTGNPQWINDERFRTAASREVFKDDRLNLTQEALREKTTAEWLDLLEGVDIPCAPVLTRREMIRHPQVAANEIIVEHRHAEAGALRQTRPPARFSKTPPEYRFGAPRLGADTSAVLKEIGYSGSEIESMLQAGAAYGAADEKEAAE